jgi:hypothetical protein
MAMPAIDVMAITGRRRAERKGRSMARKETVAAAAVTTTRAPNSPQPCSEVLSEVRNTFTGQCQR